MEINNPKLKYVPTKSDSQKSKDGVIETTIPSKKVEQPAIDRETAKEIDKKFGHLKEPTV